MKQVTKQVGRALGWVSLLALWLGLAPAAMGHGGGTPRLTAAPAGPYSVYVWSEPEPWRAGEVHLSIAVTLPAEADAQVDGAQVETPVTDADIRVTFTPADGSGPPIVVQAQRQAQLGNYYFEADTTLPAEGEWQIAIAVAGAAGSGTTEFAITALAPHTVNWTLSAAAGGVLLLILALMGLWSRGRQPARPQRPMRRAAHRSAP